ncbi:hypothetical protein BS47DRAFT_1394236 [Hydnum rufescens UP504]|uniref:FAD-binding PCMH-type domain-containing protein n=1 Tax=Hydnum rufescens UP504 TaxID=1448309 RepID=A0A9P6DSN8_9AGAM|nr:hypothetical protein BS47DRAFT_1394236 [Hydnum rufescens UP504]
MFSPYAALTLLSQTWSWFAPQDLATGSPYTWMCTNIERAVPTARLSYPGSGAYANDTYHWLPSSSQASACSVEPGNIQDVSDILKVLSRYPTVPFAIKAGGRATNPGFSSTPGIQIALSKFKDVTYDPKLHTATVGAGLSWAELYTELEKLGVTVVGGRIVGVGMLLILFPLGYSYISNRHGLVIDNIVAFKLVLPNGRTTTVTTESNPELSWALKGGYNNFGIITHYVFKTYSLGNLWGGGLIYTGGNISLVVPAVADFQASNTNVDATVVAVYARAPSTPPILSVTLFYNGTTRLRVSLTSSLLSQELKKTTTSGKRFFDVMPYKLLIHGVSRGAMHTVSLTDLSVPYYYDGPGSFTQGSSLIVFIEPFIATGGVTSAKNDSSYPHDKFFTPLSLLWRWPGEGSDDIAREKLKKAAAAITATAESEGQQLADLPLYSDYSLSDIPLEKLYTVNLPKLRSIRAKYDPAKTDEHIPTRLVMDRAGGFHF